MVVGAVTVSPLSDALAHGEYIKYAGRNSHRARGVNMYDLVITGGLLVDGTGGPPRRADVAVRDGLIVAVGAHRGEPDAAVAHDHGRDA
ncbi:MAG: hypothetical protein ABIS86_14450, partial [Streptosporangiaceae bacterium]